MMSGGNWWRANEIVVIRHQPGVRNPPNFPCQFHAESFRDAGHLKEILREGQTIVDKALAGASATEGLR